MLQINPRQATTAGKSIKRKLAALAVASTLAWGVTAPAFATIDNTVTASGTYLGAPISTTSTENVDVADQIATLRLDKQGTVNDGGDGTADAGDTISYTFDITNTGNVNLRNVVLSDNIVTPGLPALGVGGDVLPLGDSTDTAAPGWFNLGPGDTIRQTAVYTLTPADVDAGRVINIANVNATTIPGLAVTATDTVETRLNVTYSLTLDKSGALDLGPNARADVGDLITYQFLVTNTGNTTLTNVDVSDPLVDFASLPGHERVIALMEGATTAFDNITTASISGLAAPQGQPYGWLFQMAAKAKGNAPQLQTALHVTRKLINLSGQGAALVAGDKVGIYFDLVNAGEGPLTEIRVEQATGEAFGNQLELLGPNTTDSASVIYTHTLTADDVTAGTLSPVATVTAQSRGSTLVETLVDTMVLAEAETLDEIATATITPANVPSLAPGASTTFTATYPLTQADIDAGSVANTATATGINIFNETISVIDSFVTPVPKAPGIAVVKTSSVNLGPDLIASVGDIITYNFTVTNTGNVTLDDVRIADPLTGLTLAGAPLNNFAPAAVNSVNFTGTYAITQIDIDAGEVINQATASGLPRNEPTRVTDLSDESDPLDNDPTITPLAPVSRIALIKRVTDITDINANGLTDLGDRVNYNFQVQNTGNTTLTNVYVQDRNPLVVVTPVPPTGLTLLPGAINTTTFTAQYVLTQADVDVGFFDNTADTFGMDPNSVIVRDESDPAVFTANAPTRVTIPAQPAIAILKRVSSITDVNGNSLTDLNDIINYAFTVVNTGNVTLTGVTVTDPNAVVAGGPLASLAPGVSDATTFTATHLVTPADMVAGRVTNRATARGNGTRGGAVSDLSDSSDLTEDDPTITPITAQPAISVIKRVTGIQNTNANAVVDAGDTILYAFEVRNTGNVPLTNVQITDTLIPVVPGLIALLEAGDTDTTTFTGAYVITAADMLAGQVVNQATVRGTSPNTTIVTDASDESSFTGNDPTITYLANSPSIAVVKTVTGITDTNANSINDAGDVINYAFTVTNTGNVALSNVTLTDANAVVAPGSIALLAVSGVDGTTFTATHVITVPDVNAAGVTNSATVSGNGPSGPVTDISDNNSITENDPTFVALSQSPGIALVKTASSITDANGNGRTDVGDTVNYAFNVTNTGNVTLTGIVITDTNATVSGGPLTLAPGASNNTTFTATHVVTVADSDAEQIINQAQAQGTSPLNTTVSDLSDDDSPLGNDPTVTLVSAPLPVLTKTVARSEIRRGERAMYTITASNLRLGPYDVADIMPPGFDFVAGSATVNGVAAVPAQSGNTLTFPAVAPDALATITIKLQLLSSTTLSTGRFINKARLYLNATGDLLASAEVAVTIKEEHVFDCGEIIGRVFDDLNSNGYADEGEPGLAGVRVATVKGVLVTTDEHGRFHVTCADVPNAAIGSNFLMKLDTRTLPLGYALTTENPRDVRLTRGKITKLNFGVSKRHDVNLDLTRDAFNGNTTNLKTKWQSGVGRLVSLLTQGKGALTITYRCGQYAPIVDDRLAAVKELVEARWDQEGGNKPLKITTRVECGK